MSSADKLIQDKISTIAFTSITTGLSETYLELIKFYRSFGFQIVRSYTKDLTSSNGQDLRSVSSESRKECWLKCYPVSRTLTEDDDTIVPFQETPEYIAGSESGLNDFNKGAMIKIRLLSHDVHKNIGGPSRYVFFTSEIAKIKEIAVRKNYEAVETSPDDRVELLIKDPIGNLVGFTSYVNGISDIKVKSSNDFFNRTELPPQPVEVTTSASGHHTIVNKPKRKIAVMTSGGDSPGMNPAVRAVVRAGIFYGCEVYGCYEGYSGLVAGGELLKKMEWEDVRGWLSLGGTLIGTARCKEFRERAGRLTAAKNMVLEGIDALVVIGGDGSLTGADLFRSEWPSLIDELVETGELTTKQVDPYRHLNIVGLVGSIDNDMSSTDNTIGAFSSLERICEMVDYIDSTAASHSRAFVVEVMGRHCGWLGLMAGIASGADFIFIPERPPSATSWKDELKAVCQRHREKGRRKTTVIVAEGALDDELNPITSEQVKDCLVEIGLDTRITTLGHVQRGGTAVAIDRLLATLQGVDAIKAILEMTPETPSPMIGISEGKIVRRSLKEAVALTKSVAESIENKDFDKALSLRDPAFIESYGNFLSLSKGDDLKNLLPEDERLNIAIIHVGAPSAALNAATRAAALYCLSKGHTPYGIENGFSGLIRHGSFKKLEWLDVEEWHNLGGSELGTNRTLPSKDLGTVAYYLQKFEINGLMIIGGFEAFRALNDLETNKVQFPIFNMPMVCLPATVSNNVPGTQYSLGTDTCLNTLVNYCDAVKQSASASRRRVFVVEVQGGQSGYIATSTALITGALAVYTPEKKTSLSSIQEDLDLLRDNFANDTGGNRSGKMFIRNECASEVYTTELIADIIKSAGEGKFESRTAIPGHVQQGKSPSSMDRCYAARFSIKACEFIEEYNKTLREDVKGLVKEGYGANSIKGKFEKGYAESDLGFYFKNGQKINLIKDNAMVVGIHGSNVSFDRCEDVWNNQTDVKNRKGIEIHWSDLAEVNDVLSGRLLLRKKEHRL